MKNSIYLAHHGVKGQKWGVRRYQNPDGTRIKGPKLKGTKGLIKSNSVNEDGTVYKIKYKNPNISKNNDLDKLDPNKISNYEFAEKYNKIARSYINDIREKGKDKADEILHNSLKNVSYEMILNKEDYYNETYTLKVLGNKIMYQTSGNEEDYYDGDFIRRIEK